MNDANSLSHTTWNCKYYMIALYRFNIMSCYNAILKKAEQCSGLFYKNFSQNPIDTGGGCCFIIQIQRPNTTIELLSCVVM